MTQVMTSRRFSRGLWIAFFGPDGIGKSTVIEHLERQVQPAFDGIVRFHFRPGFRRCGRDGSPVTQPHAMRQRSPGISTLKLLFWLGDCWFGYLTAICPGRSHRRLIIFDRYLPDLLVDPVRYRLPLRCSGFARWLTALAPQPDLYVLLDAPAEVVQERKSELPLTESRRQRNAYLKMFEELHSRLIVSAEFPAAEVARNVAAVLSTLYSESC